MGEFPSGQRGANDAASVIASDVSGGDLTAFVAQMNARAKELGTRARAISASETPMGRAACEV